MEWRCNAGELVANKEFQDASNSLAEAKDPHSAEEVERVLPYEAVWKR
jgi:hypothetical protein